MQQFFLILVMITLLFSDNAIAAPLQNHDYNSSTHNNPIGKIVEDTSFGLLHTNLGYSDIIFDRQEHVTNKPVKQLEMKSKGNIDNNKLYIGGRFLGSFMFEKTNTDGKFPILSRLPDSHGDDDHNEESVINEASVNLTYAPISWVTLFGQLEYTEVEYPGQDSTQFRKYYVMLGDLNILPIYGLFGRNTVSFGNFTSYAPFTHNHSSHYFWAQSDDPHFEVGYYDHGLHIAASLIPDGRGLRVINSPDGDGFENFAISARQQFNFSENISAEIGLGYLRGSIYDSSIAHHPPSWNFGDNDWNAVYNIHATLSAYNFDFNAEYTQTEDDWPATNDKVLAFTIQSRYHHHLSSDVPAIISMMYSRGEQGESGTEWEFMEQLVAGYEAQLHPNIRIGAEYLFNRGFVPLIMPTFTGDRDVESHTGILGIELTF